MQRATDFRKLCYTEIQDLKGSVTATWLDTGAQTTDEWTNVCGVSVSSCPTLKREYGEVPESHRTHMTMESVVYRIVPRHPEPISISRGFKVIDVQQYNKDSTDDAGNPEVVETVQRLTEKMCLARSNSIHQECFTGAESGTVTALWMPSMTSKTTRTSLDKTVYFKKTAAQLNGQTGCKISMSGGSSSCPRALAQNKELAWDQIPHTEWTHKSKAACLARATEIYDFCNFWPGADSTLNNYINHNDHFIGRPDLFYPGAVTAQWAGVKNEFGNSQSGSRPAETTVCTGQSCAPGAISTDFSTIKHTNTAVKPLTGQELDQIEYAIYDKDANFGASKGGYISEHMSKQSPYEQAQSRFVARPESNGDVAV
jgi:hypothetical protein